MGGAGQDRGGSHTRGSSQRMSQPRSDTRVAVQCKLPRVNLTPGQAGQPSHSHTCLLLGTGLPGDINSHKTCTKRHR